MVQYPIHYNKPENAQLPDTEVAMNQGLEAVTPKKSKSEYSIDGKFMPKLLANDILNNHITAFHDGQRLFCYMNGVYVPEGEVISGK